MLLEVSELAVDVATRRGLQRVVDRTSFSLDEGESLGVVGESGSGKTMTALALMGLTPEGARVSGSIRFEGRELVGTSPDLTRHHMEVRGLGVINVLNIFGIVSVRLEKRLDLIVTLKDWQELEEVDRIGLDQEYYDILERTQKGTLDATGWLAWFLQALRRAVDQSQETVDAVLVYAQAGHGRRAKSTWSYRVR